MLSNVIAVSRLHELTVFLDEGKIRRTLRKVISNNFGDSRALASNVPLRQQRHSLPARMLDPPRQIELHHRHPHLPQRQT